MSVLTVYPDHQPQHGERYTVFAAIQQQLDAAQAAGFETVWLIRDSAPDPQAGHRQVISFDLITAAI